VQADGQLAGASHHRSPDPYFHQTVVARTPDGLTLTGARQVIDHASVPDGVRRADASVLVYT
jgi:hypothetical protein